MRDYGTDATTGRGMRLVDSISSRWGVDRSPDRKVVWFELPQQGSQEQAWDDDTDAEVLIAAFSEDEEALEPIDGPGDAPRVLEWAA